MVSNYNRALERAAYWEQVAKEKEEQINKGQWSKGLEKEYSAATYKAQYWREGAGYIKEGASYKDVQSWVGSAATARLNATEFLSFQERQTQEGQAKLAAERAGAKQNKVVVGEKKAEVTQEKVKAQEVYNPKNPTLKESGSVGYYYDLDTPISSGSPDVYIKSETGANQQFQKYDYEEIRAGRAGYIYNPYVEVPAPVKMAGAVDVGQERPDLVDIERLNLLQTATTDKLYYSEDGKLAKALPYGLTPYGSYEKNWYIETDTGLKRARPTTIVSGITSGLLTASNFIVDVNKKLNNPVTKTSVFQSLEKIQVSANSPLYYSSGKIVLVSALLPPQITMTRTQAFKYVASQQPVNVRQDILVERKGAVSDVSLKGQTNINDVKISSDFSRQIVKTKGSYSAAGGKGVSIIDKGDDVFQVTKYNIAGGAKNIQPVNIVKNYGSYSVEIPTNVNAVAARSITEKTLSYSFGNPKLIIRAPSFNPTTTSGITKITNLNYQTSTTDIAGFLFKTNDPNINYFFGKDLRGSEVFARITLKTSSAGSTILGSGASSQLSTTSITKTELSSAITQSAAAIPQVSTTADYNVPNFLTSLSSIASTQTKAEIKQKSPPKLDYAPSLTQRNKQDVIGDVTEIAPIPKTSTGLRLGSLPYSKPVVTPLQKPAQSQKQRPVQKLVKGLRFGDLTPAIAVPALNFGFGSNVPPITFLGRFGKTNLSSRVVGGGKRVTGYIPSFTALFKRQYGKKPKLDVQTGLEFRPIPFKFKFKSGVFNFPKLKFRL